MPDEQSSPTACPACRGRLYPKLLKCADCGAEVTTRYAGNEFAELAPEDLHLLRIFVHCEGSIREMEAALGVSYPTVKARIAALRQRLGLAATAEPAARARPEREPVTAGEILDRLADGTLTYAEALPKIRALRGRT